MSVTATSAPPGLGDGRLQAHRRAAVRTRLLLTLAAVNLTVQGLIVVTGGVVRLTGSGLGCPTWPECTDGSIAPTVDQVEGWTSLVEFGNRTLTGLVGLAALAVLAGVLRYRRRLWPLAALPLAGTAIQAVLGGVTVLTRLHPGTVMAHFLVSIALVAASTVLLLRLREPGGPVVSRLPVPVRTGAWLLAATGAAVVVLGTVVTGAGPHSGDADEPVRFEVSARAVAWAHADLVMLFSGLLVGLLVAVLVGRSVTGPADTRPWGALARRAWYVAAVVVVQGAVGYAQYLLAVPRPLVAVHMALAVVFTIVVTALVMATRVRSADGDTVLPTPSTTGASA